MTQDKISVTQINRETVLAASMEEGEERIIRFASDMVAAAAAEA